MTLPRLTQVGTRGTMRTGRRIRHILGMTLVGVLLGIPAWAQQAPPELTVALSFNKTQYQFGDPNDPLVATLVVRNVTGHEVLVSSGFANRPFELFLTFRSPSGKGVVAEDVDHTGGEGPPPTTVLVNGYLVQVDPIDVLPATFSLTVTIPDARRFYTLPSP